MTYVLDTNVVIYFLGGQLRDPLPLGWYAVSVITQIELLSHRGLTTADRAGIEAFLAKCLLVPVTSEIGLIAANLRSTSGLKTPDAIIGATAEHLKATIISNDQALLSSTGIPGMTVELN